MHLDIRIPIGLLFAVLGAMLTVFGVLTMFNLIDDKSIYDRSLGINVNLWWGLVMLAFGIVMLWFGRRGTSTVRPASESPEGRKIEAREHRTGLEQEPKNRGH